MKLGDAVYADSINSKGVKGNSNGVVISISKSGRTAMVALDYSNWIVRCSIRKLELIPSEKRSAYLADINAVTDDRGVIQARDLG